MWWQVANKDARLSRAMARYASRANRRAQVLRLARQLQARSLRMTPRVGLALVICGLLALAGCKGRTPGSFETAVATEVKRRITVGGDSNRNPLPATAESIHAGQVNFSHYCMACHGLDGQNTGVPFAEKMSPPPPPLNSKQVQRYTDGQLKWVIENGLFPSGMPAARGILNDDEMWSIVNYIRHLPPKGSLGEPPAYSGEPPAGNALGQTAPPTNR